MLEECKCKLNTVTHSHEAGADEQRQDYLIESNPELKTN